MEHFNIPDTRDSLVNRTYYSDKKLKKKNAVFFKRCDFRLEETKDYLKTKHNMGSWNRYRNQESLLVKKLRAFE